MSNNLNKAAKVSRRKMLQLSASLPMLGASPLAIHSVRAEVDPAQRKFLFVIGAAGGASILDSFLTILDTDSNNPDLNTFTAAQLQQPNGSNLRCPIPMENSIQGAIPLGDGYNMATFLGKHAADTAVMTQEVSSVNHFIAARRSVTGDNVNGGRTIQEATAMQYGLDLLLPNCNMSGDGYGGNGDDSKVDALARAENILDARYFSFSTDGRLGVQNSPSLLGIDQARSVRKKLEMQSSAALGKSALVSQYVAYRDQLMPNLEAAKLINKLMIMQSSPNGKPLTDFDLEQSVDGIALAEKFPNLQADPFEAQTALAFLLTKYGVANVNTIAPSGSPFITEQREALSAPIGFDWSHLDHRGAQNAMWGRIMHMADNLIDLLKANEYMNGKSLWDHSLVYIATEFGRDKVTTGGSGHHLNNGVVMISPLLNGNRVYGGVDPNTAMTYGFNPVTGAPDTNAKMKEGDIYSALCNVLGIEFQGRKDMPCLVKNTA